MLFRSIANRKFKDRLDQESIEFHSRVAKGYQTVLEVFNDRMILIDASNQLDVVIELALEKVLEIING